MRASSEGGGAGLKATHLLFFIQLFVFLVLTVGDGKPWQGSLIGAFGLSSFDALLTQPWSLLTCSFLNHHPLEFVIGGGILLLVGVAVETRMGASRFVLFYLLAGALTGIVHVVLFSAGVVAGQVFAGSVGASAGLLTAYLFLLGRDRHVGSLPFPVFYVLAACALFAAMAVVAYNNDNDLQDERGKLVAAAAGPGASVSVKVETLTAIAALEVSQTDELGHLSGFVVGGFALFMTLVIVRTSERYRVFREIRGLQEEVDARARVELLLAKITQDGIGSLTRPERKFLNYASRFYKQSSRLSKTS